MGRGPRGPGPEWVGARGRTGLRLQGSLSVHRADPPEPRPEALGGPLPAHPLSAGQACTAPRGDAGVPAAHSPTSATAWAGVATGRCPRVPQLALPLSLTAAPPPPAHPGQPCPASLSG